MGNKKMGRPTDNPKDISLKILLDRDSANKLDEYSQAFQVSKAETIRRGINEMHSKLQK